MNLDISPQDLAAFEAEFDADPKNRLALNAVTKNGISAVALNREVLMRTNHTYSHFIKTPEATNQKSSGRCWLFAALNTFRLAAMEKMNLEKFELSQAYPFFWDKLEKSNYFLENIILTRDEPLDGRLVMALLADPIPDGGQWDMLVNLVKKYGVVPKSVMPETKCSSATRYMNALVVAKLREYAHDLRSMYADGASPEEMRTAKAEMMKTIYRMLVIHLGKPPLEFEWEWRDKDNEFHRHEGRLTPQEFFAEYVGIDLDDMVCLINAPTADKPYGKMYTVQYLGNVVGGQIVRYLNVDIETLKKCVVDTIVDGQVVWFGSDVGKFFEREAGILDLEVHDLELVYGEPLKQDKAGRLDYGQSRMTHAMVLTGVDLDEAQRPRKWRVENSWGDKIGDKGYMVMSDAWFDEYLYEVVVSKSKLPPELLAVLDTEPIELPLWDPMGALARQEALL